MAHIRPEYLLEPRDYRQWLRTQTKTTDGDSGGVDCVHFELLSKRAWMDVLLQLIKVTMILHSSRSIRFVHSFILFHRTQVTNKITRKINILEVFHRTDRPVDCGTNNCPYRCT